MTEAFCVNFLYLVYAIDDPLIVKVLFYFRSKTHYSFHQKIQ